MGKETEVFIRFSTVAGERGAADAERDIRGVACKFYTEEGNWDLVGNNTPTFFLRDVHNFPDLNRAIKRDPRTGLRSAQNNWDFRTQQGIKNLTDEEAEALVVKDRESHGRDLYESIEKGDYPKWTMYV